MKSVRGPNGPLFAPYTLDLMTCWKSTQHTTWMCFYTCYSGGYPMGSLIDSESTFAWRFWSVASGSSWTDGWRDIKSWNLLKTSFFLDLFLSLLSLSLPMTSDHLPRLATPEGRGGQWQHHCPLQRPTTVNKKNVNMNPLYFFMLYPNLKPKFPKT